MFENIFNCQSSLVEKFNHSIFEFVNQITDELEDMYLCPRMIEINKERVFEEFRRDGLSPTMKENGEVDKEMYVTRLNRRNANDGLTNKEILKMARKKNNEIYKLICAKLSQVFGYNSKHATMEAFKPLTIRVSKTQA